MFEFRLHGLKAAATWLLLAEITFTAQVTARTTSRASTYQTPTPSPSICPSRSINYIIQSLPQQCFTASWSSRVTPQSNTTSLSTTTLTGQDFVVVTSVTPTTSSVHSSVESSNPNEVSRNDTSVTLDSTTSTAPTIVNDAPPSAEVSPKASPSTPDLLQDADSESPLDNANFLSFEEWKKQNLKMAGQSEEGLGTKTGGPEQRRRPGGISNALDSLGEDVEIDIDFGGFVGQGPMPNAPPLRGTQVQETASADDQPVQEHRSQENSGARKRPKDAGKTCKERTNYASYDCAASTVKTNAECKSPSAILVENKDSYMLNICSAKNKLFIVELCDNILIDTIVLANFEFFSSMFRTFRVSVSDKYPVKLDRWKELGTFNARNSRDIQAFLVENPVIWARYVRVEMLSHYGNEYYCPVSLFRVHGTTMMEEFNNEMKSVSGDDEGEGDEGQTTEEPPEEVQQLVVTAEVIRESTMASSAQVPMTPSDIRPQDTESTSESNPSIAAPAERSSIIPLPAGEARSVRRNNTAAGQLEQLFEPWIDVEHRCSYPSVPPSSTSQSASQASSSFSTPTEAPSVGSLIKPAVTTSQSSNMSQTVHPESTPISAGTNVTSSTMSSTVAAPLSSQNTTKAVVSRVDTTSTGTIKAQASPNQQAPSNPTTQESFFKSVHKRLQMLEANSTLSLQYIEEQSRILRDAFSKVEKRQMVKTTIFLETLNSTVLNELVEFRRQYDQIWQSTVLELSSQREQSQQEVFALSARLSLLADEIVFQKRMTILQSLLILLCLGLVIFSRNGSASPYMEFRPFVQNAINKSSANLSRYASQLESPTTSPSASRPSSRYGLLRSLTHYRSASQESYTSTGVGGTKPNIEYSPPTPESQSSVSGGSGSSPGRPSLQDGDSSDGPPEAEEEVHPRSTPATPEAKKEEKRQFLEDAFLSPDSPGQRQ